MIVVDLPYVDYRAQLWQAAWCKDYSDREGTDYWFHNCHVNEEDVIVDRFYFLDEQMAILFTLRWK